MHSPGVAASKTAGAHPGGRRRLVAVRRRARTTPGVPGAGKPRRAAGPSRLGNGCAVAGRRARRGPQGPPVGAAGVGATEGAGGAGGGCGRRPARRGPVAGWPAGAPVHRTPGRVRGHRRGDHVEGSLRVAGSSGRRDQGGQRGYRDRRLVERRSVLGGQRRHLLDRLGRSTAARRSARRTRRDARPARTPVRPPRSPCRHRSRGRRPTASDGRAQRRESAVGATGCGAVRLMRAGFECKHVQGEPTKRVRLTCRLAR